MPYFKKGSNNFYYTSYWGKTTGGAGYATESQKKYLNVLCEKNNIPPYDYSRMTKKEAGMIINNLVKASKTIKASF